jgi:hypothetical protein
MGAHRGPGSFETVHGHDEVRNRGREALGSGGDRSSTTAGTPRLIVREPYSAKNAATCSACDCTRLPYSGCEVGELGESWPSHCCGNRGRAG